MIDGRGVVPQPMFSDFKFNEGEPIKRTRTAVVYKAQRQGRAYALKILHPPDTTEESTADPTSRGGAIDLAAFLETVAQQKKAAEEGLHGCAPIYESGYTP